VEWVKDQGAELSPDYGGRWGHNKNVLRLTRSQVITKEWHFTALHRLITDLISYCSKPR